MKPYTLLLIVSICIVFAIVVDYYRKAVKLGKDLFDDEK